MISRWTLLFTDDVIIIFDPIPKVIKLDLAKQDSKVIIGIELVSMNVV